MSKIRFGKYAVDLPRSRALRVGIGVLLVLGGLVGFLPVLGFWMIPLGFMVLAGDFPAVRRLNRRVSTSVMRWWRGRKPRPHPGDA